MARKNIEIGKHNNDWMELMTICPKCGEEDKTYSYDTTDLSFEMSGNGYVECVCFCKECQERFISKIKFKYQITEAFTVN